MLSKHEGLRSIPSTIKQGKKKSLNLTTCKLQLSKIICVAQAERQLCKHEVLSSNLNNTQTHKKVYMHTYNLGHTIINNTVVYLNVEYKPLCHLQISYHPLLPLLFQISLIPSVLLFVLLL